ncbi:H-NS family nucleoid-associated regulatory protein [Paraburkholderia sediminicola]|uniref:hypothetical protein n=1 Tax=Paraburkholderia sediminicola TaxID=458836 RepID=UPI0038B93536
MMNGTTIETKLAKPNKLSDEHARFTAAAAAAVVSLLSEYRLTLDDLQTPAKPSKAKPVKPAQPVKATTAETAKKRKAPFKGPQSPRYRDPDSGATWSGLGSRACLDCRRPRPRALPH